jgi:hypothetical protein
VSNLKALVAGNYRKYLREGTREKGGGVGEQDEREIDERRRQVMKRKLFAIGCGFFVFVAAVQAVPTYISDGLMTWQRGVDGSTWQDWTFDTAQNAASPEQFYNPYGDPSIAFTGSDGSISFRWKNGVWQGDPLNASIVIPNNPQPNPSKTVWFEMVYKGVDSVPPTVSAGQGYQVDEIYSENRKLNDNPTDYWYIMTMGWTIVPNPELESITFTLVGTGGFLTSVSVDTLCIVPVPGAILLAGIGLGVVGLTRKQLRRI